jgi:alpha-ketoglutarate-dependent taurine dioxygenase
MSDEQIEQPGKQSLWASRRKAARPKAVNVLEESLIRTEYLDAGATLPLVVKPAVEGVSLVDWAAHHREFIEISCQRDGAVLFRNFHVSTAEEFERVIQAVSGKAMEYQERSSPRSSVSGNVYTSTDYPAEQSIFPHNEHSYAKNPPMKLYFGCLVPAQQGGQTPIADTRKIFRRISQRTRERFLEKKWMYVRNFGDGFGLPWQTVFRTTEKDEVERYCRDAGIECEWRDGNRLRTRQVRPAVIRHPRSGEMVWFNHATFFHISTLPSSIRDALLAEFKVEDLPNNTYYGDGSEIEPSVLDELRAAYLENLTTFEWERGDVIILDNMLTAHARRPFAGARKVIFGMAEPFTRTDI